MSFASPFSFFIAFTTQVVKAINHLLFIFLFHNTVIIKNLYINVVTNDDFEIKIYDDIKKIEIKYIVYIFLIFELYNKIS
jgi:hypothetical protein